jgi:hypothetical protein
MSGQAALYHCGSRVVGRRVVAVAELTEVARTAAEDEPAFDQKDRVLRPACDRKSPPPHRHALTHHGRGSDGGEVGECDGIGVLLGRGGRDWDGDSHFTTLQ